MLKEKIIFFNHFHNGDLHHSRNFVKYFINNYKKNIDYLYAHENSVEILQDIPNCTYENIKNLQINYKEQIINNGNSIYINTWVGQLNFKYLNLGFGCSFKTNLKLWKDIYNYFKIDMPDDLNILLPSIDLEFKSITPDKKCILFCNNITRSGQSDNFNMSELIFNYAIQNKNIECVVSNWDLINKKMPENVKRIDDYCLNDLNHIGIFSQKCDIIVGRTSGPFCFTLTKNNYFMNKVFISFANGNEDDVFWHTTDKNKYFILKKENANDLIAIK